MANLHGNFKLACDVTLTKTSCSSEQLVFRVAVLQSSCSSEQLVFRAAGLQSSWLPFCAKQSSEVSFYTIIIIRKISVHNSDHDGAVRIFPDCCKV